MITRNDISAPSFFQPYVDAIIENDLQQALDNNTKAFTTLLQNIPNDKIDYAYAEGKWTIKEVLQHIIDAERVFVYRALTFARKDAANLPGFDENNWAVAAQTNNRKWETLAEEFKALRYANTLFLNSLNDEQLQQTGTANGNTVSVAALAFITAGHVAHHMRILKERYLVSEFENGQIPTEVRDKF